MTLLDRPIQRVNIDSSNGGAAAELLTSGAAMQQTRGTYTTAVAVQKPRELSQVLRRLLEEASLAGEDFYYGWGAGRDAIEGPSIELALAAARCWGNCAVELLPVAETATAWIFTAAFVDLETGFTLSRQFRQSKDWKVFGKFDEERKTDIRFQIGQSKAIRNCVLNAMPAALVSKAMSKAKEGVKTRIEEFVEAKGLPAAVDMVIRALAKVAVTEERILSKLGIANRTAIDIDMLVTLRGDLAALEGGRERAEELYPAAGSSSLDEKLAQAKAAKAAKQQSVSSPPPTGGAAPTDSEPPAGVEEPDVPPVEEQVEVEQAEMVIIKGIPVKKNLPDAARKNESFVDGVVDIAKQDGDTMKQARAKFHAKHKPHSWTNVSPEEQDRLYAALLEGTVWS